MQIKKTEKGKNIFFRTSITSLGEDMFKTVGLVLINYIKTSKLQRWYKGQRPKVLLYSFLNVCHLNGSIKQTIVI